MHILATSYEGFALGMQMPFSLVAALISLACAFKRDLRSVSVMFACFSIFFALCGLALELNNYGFYCFEHIGTFGYACMVLSPFALAIGIIIFGSSKFRKAPTRLSTPTEPQNDLSGMPPEQPKSLSEITTPDDKLAHLVKKP